ncbi:MAG: DegQ family serine endoprotease [Gammaproteobacteria bacterium]|nr:DegQ family serine endoprotease [Gammaproteobacteria bacterium]
MRALMLAVIAAVSLVGQVAVQAQEVRLPDFTVLAKKNSPAVVNISTTMKAAKLSERLPPGLNMPDIPQDGPLGDFFRHFFGDEGPGGPDGGPGGPGGQDPRSSLGSGFILSKDGYIITNYHVVREADEIIVRMSDRSEHAAKLIGSDQRSDVAVLKIDTDKDLPTITPGDSDKLEVGEWVLAIGSPFGFDYSVTAGIVSAKGRSLPNENYVPFIQTDVAINPGNSGGPLFNLKGEVVGVNSQIYSRTGGFMGVSFAIPIQVVLNVYQQLRDHGSVTRGWLGVLIQDVTSELAESFGMQKPTGALVSKVLDGSPAEKAGLRTGDIILSFSGANIERSSDLPPMVGNTHVGDKIAVELIRDGKRQKSTIEIGALPEEQPEVAEGAQKEKSKLDAKLKIAVTEPTKQQREQAQVNDGGVLIEDIADGPAYSAGLRSGDIILQLNNRKIAGLKDFREQVEALTPGKTVPILIQRQGGPLFLAMKVPGKDG